MIRCFICLLVGLSPVFASATSHAADSAEIRKLAESIGEATIKGNSSKVIDQTFDKAVQILGGREKGISAMNSAMRRMRQSGVAIVGYKIGEPGPVMAEGKYSFCVVPATLEMNVPKARLVSKSYLLGISSDAGKTWKFLDGAGLKDLEMRNRVLPKLPAGLTLPEIPMPEIIPGN